MTLVQHIIDFEDGSLEPELVPPLFQALVNTGMAWGLQGSYGRAATELLREGIISPADQPDLADTSLLEGYVEVSA